MPEDLRFLVPVRNLVTTVSAGAALGRGMRFDIEGGMNDTQGDDTTRAGGFRGILTLADRADRRLLLEYHAYDPDFFPVGSPTVDGGERGVVIDGSIRPVKALHQSAKLEVYRDVQSSQDLESDSYIVQFYGRTDVEGKAGGASWNPYFLFRIYDIPYQIDRYTSRYGTAGLFARRGEHTLSLSATRSTTRSSSNTDSWTAAVYATGSVGGGRFSWKAGEQYSRTVVEGETEVVAADSGAVLDMIEGRLSEEERWTFSADLALKLFGFEWRSEYERIDEEDRVENTHFTQHLLSLVMGVYF